MKKTIGELIKELRIENKLTQKEFGDKFFLSSKTISNYENMDRMPDLEFITKVCEEFNLSLDYFTQGEKEKCDPHELMKSYKKEKCALYDKKNSVCLTRFAYDDIIISYGDYHILLKYAKDFNAKFLYTKETIKNGITYSGLIDNYGRITEFKDLVFGLTGSFEDAFNIFDTTFAFSKKTNKVHIVNAKGEILSEGYDRIYKVEPSNINFGPYVAINYSDKSYKQIQEFHILNYDGRMLNYQNTFDDFNNFRDVKISAFSDVNELCNAISEYGPAVTLLAPKEVFSVFDNTAKVFVEITKWADSIKDLSEKVNFADFKFILFMIYFKFVVNEKTNISQADYENKYKGSKIFEDVTINNRELKKYALIEFNSFLDYKMHFELD